MPIISKGQYIQGTWVKGKGDQLDSINPATDGLLWQGTQATLNEILMAHSAAKETLSSWSLLPFEERANTVSKFADIVEKRQDELALLIAQETGKPLWEALLETKTVIAKTGLSIKAYQERSWPKENLNPELRSQLRYKPQGVVVVLGPFNFPAHISNGHIIPALLAGNTVLYKPSEQTPAVAEFIMQCWHESYLPPGVLQCLQGDAQCGAHLLNQSIQGVYFTGSYSTGLAIHKQFSERPEVIVALEMGGNNPLLIDEVSNVPAAVYNSLISTLLTSGQRCTSTRRLLIPDGPKGDNFLKQFITACQKIQIGAFDAKPHPFMGPVISHNQALQHLNAQKKLLSLGGEPLLAMQLLRENTALLSPAIIDMSKVPNPPDEEIFGPLIQVHRYHFFEQAIELANKTRFGLAASLLSDNPAHYQQFYQQVKAGLINWNRPTTGSSSELPFGGIGHSGNHRPSGYFAADYCSYPIASIEQPQLVLPEEQLPGIHIE